MPIAQFETPDGRIAEFDVPDGTTPEEAQAQAQAFFDTADIPSEVAAQKGIVAQDTVAQATGSEALGTAAGAVTETMVKVNDWFENPKNARQVVRGAYSMAGSAVGLLAGPAGMVVGSAAGDMAGSAAAELGGLDPSPNVQTAVARAGAGGTEALLGEMTGQGIAKVAGNAFGFAKAGLSDVGQEIEKRYGQKSLPISAVANDGAAAKVDSMLGAAMLSGDTAIRKELVDNITADTEDLLQKIRGNSQYSLADIGTRAKAVSREISDRLVKRYVQKSSDILAKTGQQGVTVNISGLGKDLNDIVKIANLKNKDIPKGQIVADKDLNSLVADFTARGNDLPFEEAFYYRQRLSEAVNELEGEGQRAAKQMLDKLDDTVKTQLGTGKGTVGKELYDNYANYRKFKETYETGVLASLAKADPEAAVNSLIQPGKAKQARVLRAMMYRAGDKALWEDLQARTVDKLIAQSTNPGGTLAGKKLLNSLDKLDASVPGNQTSSVVLAGQENAKELYTLGRMLKQAQLKPGSENLITIRGAQSGAIMSAFFTGANQLGKATQILLVPGAISRMVRTPTMRRYLTQGLSESTTKATAKTLSNTQNLVRTLLDGDMIQGIVIEGKTYPSDSPEAQAVLGKKVPQVPLAR